MDQIRSTTTSRQPRRWTLSLLTALALVALGNPAGAAYHGPESMDLPSDRQGVLILDGSFVHNVGELQLNITNWGLIGSHPSLQNPYSDAPSAMWPAGSGVDYLWAAGLWVGALKNGIPAVTTGQYTTELIANGEDPLDTIYETRQSDPAGKRYPDTGEDDDEDGVINEDPRNGVDDDGDGRIDEDYAGISNQDFRCVMRDNTALIIELRPDHEPLDIQVVQQSFQWENDAVDDFVGFEFTLTNIGINPLQDVFVGLFADCDIGPRDGAQIADDDLPGYWRGRFRANDGSFVPLSIAYMYDVDTDNGRTEGYFGMLFLNHPVDPLGEEAPPTVGITSFQNFSGQQPFDRGGDPTNDAERYELLSRAEIDNFSTDPGKAGDYRILLASGPFTPIEPNQALTFQMAMVVGKGYDGMRRNAAEAALTFYGAYFNKDADENTGIKGRETQVCKSDYADPSDLFTLFQDCVDSADFQGETQPVPIKESDLDANGCIYINNDCQFEIGRGAENCTDDGTGVEEAELAGCTGVLGREFRVPWLVGLAPPAPGMRLWETNDRVHVYWNDLSEVTKDVRLQRVDFESYVVWRADGWARPFGSSIANGPESRLWRRIAEFDKVDFFQARRVLPNGQIQVQELPLGPNTGLDVIRYTPLVARPGSPEAQQYAALDALIQEILAADPDDDTYSVSRQRPPRYQDDKGRITTVGARFPQLGDWDCCLAYMDTLTWVRLDPPVQFYEYIDREVHNGIIYFHAVTASDFEADPTTASLPEMVATGPGLVGDAQSNFSASIPKSDAQTAEQRDRFGHNIYVVPNPATRAALSEFSQLNPNADDPTGVRVEFRNLPRTSNTVRIYTLSGDLVVELPHDGSGGNGSLAWNLVSRNGQEIVSGIYLYSVESDDSAFDRVVGRFVVIR